jgi:hypothetical protein
MNRKHIAPITASTTAALAVVFAASGANTWVPVILLALALPSSILAALQLKDKRQNG